MVVEVTSYLSAFLMAFTITLVGVPIASRLAHRWGAIDHPGALKIHRSPTPRLGGLAIYGAFVMVALLFTHGKGFEEGNAILVAGSLLAFAGFLDDAGRLHPLVKLFLAMPVAGLILIYSGIHVTATPFTWANYVLTLLWVVGIVCAFNLLDNMDGLCAGVASVAALFFAVLAVLNRQYPLGILAVTTIGTALGFLWYNFHPARIFMGDGGAMFLGFVLASAGLELRVSDISQSLSWVVPVLILGVPIFDTTLVTISRLRRGLVPFASPGKDHLSHRLHNLGLGQRQVALIHYTFGLLVGGVAILVARINLSPASIYVLFGAIVFIALVAIFWLEGLPFERQEQIGQGYLVRRRHL